MFNENKCKIHLLYSSSVLFYCLYYWFWLKLKTCFYLYEGLVLKLWLIFFFFPFFFLTDCVPLCTLSCVSASRSIHGVGLVHVPGRLWTAHLKVPAGEPLHCASTFGEVCIVSTLSFSSMLISNSTEILQAS